MPKSIADRAFDAYTQWDQTKGDIRFTAPALLDPATALQEALDVQARVLDEELRAVRPACPIIAKGCLPSRNAPVAFTIASRRGRQSARLVDAVMSGSSGAVPTTYESDLRFGKAASLRTPSDY